MKKVLECRVSNLALHYNEELCSDERGSKALAKFVRKAQDLEIGGNKVFRSVSDNVGVIDLEFMGEHTTKELHKWCDWLEVTFMSVTQHD